MANQQQLSDQEQCTQLSVAQTAETMSKGRTVATMVALCASVFVAALDLTIISTITPTITENFRSALGYQWIGSSYILASVVSTPIWGRSSDHWSCRANLLFGVLAFSAGSLICALSSNIGVLLTGRVVQGIGGSGLLTLTNIVISRAYPLRERGLYFGLTSLVWACASGSAPVLGGLIVQRLSWPWCFWINIPASGVVFCLVLLAINHDTPIRHEKPPFDWIGSVSIVGSALLILVGLDYGGVTKPWSSALVVSLITTGVVLGAVFIYYECKVAQDPIIPPRLFHGRACVAAFGICFCHGYVMMGIVYYLPLYFQAVLGVDPLRSGIYLLPVVIAITLSAAAAGLCIQRTGHYMPLVHLGVVLMVLGTALLTNLDQQLKWSKIISYQVIGGLGIGLVLEGPIIAVQARIPQEDVGPATAAINFTRSIATAISVVIGGVVFQNEMEKRSVSLSKHLSPSSAAEFSGREVVAHISLVSKLPPAQRLLARHALRMSLVATWIMYAAIAGICLLLSLLIPWERLVGSDGSDPQQNENEDESQKEMT